MPLFFSFNEIVYSFKKELLHLLVSYTSWHKKDLIVLKHFLKSYKETAVLKLHQSPCYWILHMHGHY